MNTVEVTIYATQGEWDSDSLRFDEKNDAVLAEIRAAKKAGIKVIMILRVDIDHSFKSNKFIWHGMIMPGSSELIDSWFSKYQAFTEKWAKIAEQESVDVFCIGSEMNALSSTAPIYKMPALYTYYNSLKYLNRHEKRAYIFKEKLQKEDLWVNGYENYSNLKSYIEDKIKYKHAWCQQVTFGGKTNRLELMNSRRKKCRNHWKSIINNVRKIYNGPLTYAANFDNYLVADFWEELDFIGINAYFGLRNSDFKYNNSKQLKNELKRGWKKVFREINYFRNSNNLTEKPIIFTELGYIRRANATIEPWAGFGFSVVGGRSEEQLIIWGKEKDDLGERTLAMDALYEVVKEQQINLDGILYWKLTSHDYHLPYEPFALHLTPEASDSLQISLAKFSTLDD